MFKRSRSNIELYSLPYSGSIEFATNDAIVKHLNRSTNMYEWETFPEKQ